MRTLSEAEIAIHLPSSLLMFLDDNPELVDMNGDKPPRAELERDVADIIGKIICDGLPEGLVARLTEPKDKIEHSIANMLGGPDYIAAILEWCRAVDQWERSKARNKPPMPAAPEMPEAV